jgi:UDP-glucose 4-epimerase
MPATGLSYWINSEISFESLSLLSEVSGRPDFVFHLAGGSSVGLSLQSPFEDFTRTTVTTSRLLDWLRINAPQSKVIVASSAAVYGNAQNGPANTALQPAPESPYGFNKLLMELICREYAQIFGLRIAVVRLFSVYGESLRRQLLWDLSVKLRSEKGPVVLGGTGEELRDWVHVGDAVRMLQMCSAIASRNCPLIDGGSGRATSVRNVAELLIEVSGREAKVEFSGVSRAGDPKILVANPAVLGEIGYESQVQLVDGLGRYAKWFELFGTTQ